MTRLVGVRVLSRSLYCQPLLIHSQERLEEKLKSEVSFLKTQLTSEQQAKESVEDQLTSELDGMRERLGRYKAFKKELEGEQKRVKELLEAGQRQQAAQATLQVREKGERTGVTMLRR